MGLPGGAVHHWAAGAACATTVDYANTFNLRSIFVDAASTVFYFEKQKVKRVVAGTPPVTSVTIGTVVLRLMVLAVTWNESAGWENNTPPPTVIPAGYLVVINPANGECIVNGDLRISKDAVLKVMPGKSFKVTGKLILE